MDEVEKLNRMTPSQAAEERARLAAYRQRVDEYNSGVLVNGVRVYPKEFPTMTQYRADSAQPTMKAVVHVDQTGRKITEFRGTSMREWMGQFMPPGYRQLGIYNGCTPEQEMTFRRRMQAKMAALGSR